MAQPQRKAEFFVSPSGTIIPKALPLSTAERFAVFERDGGACVICGREVRKFRDRRSFFAVPVGAVDHIIARSRGGQNNAENLRLLCEPCNASKGSKLDNEWLENGPHSHHQA